MDPKSPFLKDYLGLVGAHLGPYVVREIVTMGGVAVIYRGEHETLHGAVAVKVLTPEVVADEVRATLEQLFLREAQILSQLRSDDILRAHHHGRVVCPGDNRERPYLVVDWLEGRTLSEELDDRRNQRKAYTLRESIEVLEPIARALDVAHAAGIVHRDVNPRNVFLEKVGLGVLRARLIDFGFAKEVAQTQALQLQRVTGTLLARSPDYAAPEHYDRETYGELSENTDIYTFALMFVEMLTLESPLRGTTAEALWLSTASRDDRPTPNNRGARVTAAVEAVFAEALAVDQFDRPGSIALFWERLRAAANADPAAAESRKMIAPMPAAGLPSVVPGGLVRAEPARDPARPPPIPRRPQLVPQPEPEPEPVEERAIPGVPSSGGTGKWVLLSLALVGALGAVGFVVWSRRPLECPAGFADCNGQRADGCETNIANDVGHCGRCAQSCPTTQGAAACSEGRCAISSCPTATQGDCNGDINDGCEVDLKTDTAHCGACKKACSSEGTKKVACENRECKLTCKAGRGDCDQAPANGCEADLLSDAKQCGRCGFACADGACTDGLCSPKLLVGTEMPELVATREGDVYYWDRAGKRIRALVRGGEPATVAENVDKVTGLAVGRDVLVWASGERSELFVSGRTPGAAETPRRVAGPLAGPTPLVVALEHVSWANRFPRPEAAKGVPRRPTAIAPVPRQIFTARLDNDLGAKSPVVAECNEWPASFVGDEAMQFCCDQGKPLHALECSGGKCKPRRFFIPCPKKLVLDSERLYFAQDQRVIALDRKTGEPRQLVRRTRKPLDIAIDDAYVYWIENPEMSELWRTPKPTAAAALGTSQLLARGQRRAASLVVDASSLYWVASAAEAGKTELLALPQAPSAVEPSSK
jgi:serine/threonine protein kinase